MIDSTNEQLKYEKKINSNHIFINPNLNIEDFDIDKDLVDFNIWKIVFNIPFNRFWKIIISYKIIIYKLFIYIYYLGFIIFIL